MKTTHLGLLLLSAALFTGCETSSTEGPPKSRDETHAEANAGKVPDNVRDPRPEMPPTGPMFQPMR